jgi:DNA polymerase elongation subunit (family B)
MSNDDQNLPKVLISLLEERQKIKDDIKRLDPKDQQSIKIFEQKEKLIRFTANMMYGHIGYITPDFE